MTTGRPTPLPVHVPGIPPALIAETRWAIWRYEWRDGRWTKMQYQVSRDRRGEHRGAKSNEAATWCSFADAIATYQNRFFPTDIEGISFVLGDGWAGIDIDHYLSRPSAVYPIATDVYQERSPGGDGVKLIGRAPRIGGEINFRNAGAEPSYTAWTSPRFFTITGQASCGDPTADLSAFIDERFPTRSEPLSRREGYRDAATLSDDALLLQMIGSDAGVAILALWRGDTSAYGEDHSRADQALCCHLAFWTNRDVERMDRLFRQSGLMRPKWNAASYRRATLAKALR